MSLALLFFFFFCDRYELVVNVDGDAGVGVDGVGIDDVDVAGDEVGVCVVVIAWHM